MIGVLLKKALGGLGNAVDSVTPDSKEKRKRQQREAAEEAKLQATYKERAAERQTATRNNGGKRVQMEGGTNLASKAAAGFVRGVQNVSVVAEELRKGIEPEYVRPLTPQEQKKARPVLPKSLDAKKLRKVKPVIAVE